MTVNRHRLLWLSELGTKGNKSKRNLLLNLSLRLGHTKIIYLESMHQ